MEDTSTASFGIITDLHYADHDNGFDYTKTYERFFRNSLTHLKRAVNHWNTITDMKFAIQIGDIIDGRNNKTDGESDKALNKVLSICNTLKTEGAQLPFLHVIGNHDLYNFTRNTYQNSKLASSTFYNNLKGFQNPDKKRNYYSFPITKDYNIVVLDNYDVTVLGVDDTNCEYYKEAKEYMKNNPNIDCNSHTGLFGLNERFTAYNGAFSRKQLDWFRTVLSSAEQNKKKLIIFGHTPLYADSSVKSCLAWNYNDILDIMHSYSVVKVYICGHDHRGGEATDKKGIVHITLMGTVETPLEKGPSYLTINLSPDQIRIISRDKTTVIKNV